MIYTRNGKLKFDRSLQELLAERENLPITQHDRKTGMVN